MSGELGRQLDGGGVGADEEKSNGSFDPMPVGWRAFEIETAEVKKTNAGNGSGLKLVAVVIGEEYSGRKVFPWINISNPSVQCTEIGRKELASLADACGIPFLDDEDKLIGKRLEMKLAITKNDNGESDNEVKGYRPLGGSSPTQTVTPANATGIAADIEARTPTAEQTPAPAATAGSKKMPWD